VQNGAGVTSLTGSVNLVTNQPAFDFQASGSITGGSNNLRNTEGVLNLPVGRNQALRVAYSSERRSGYYSSDAGNSDNRQFRFRYRWQPGDNLNVTASYQENRTEGNGVSQSTLLYTGHWIDYSAGQIVNWTNPFNGVSSQWGQSLAAANRISLAGLITANNVLSPGISTTNTALTTGNQYYYPAGPCSILATATTSTNVALLAPFIAGNTMDCPFRQLAIRDGVYFNQRSDPWNDGFRPYQWPNNPVRNTLQRQANIIIEWNSRIGKWTFQPGFVYNKNQFVEPARGTSWMEQGFIPSRSWRMDAQLASKPGSKLSWIAGFNGTSTLRAPDGTTFLSIALPTTGWTLGTVGMNATTTTSNSGNCYTVTPTGALTAGIPSSNQCLAPNYSLGAESKSLGLSFQGNYPILDNLRLAGSFRVDRSDAIARVAATELTTQMDASGQRYLWILPATNYATATAANPNAQFLVPYRMNLTDTDMLAMATAYETKRSSTTNAYTLGIEYDFVPVANFA
jgi:hypothetical protein